MQRHQNLLAVLLALVSMGHAQTKPTIPSGDSAPLLDPTRPVTMISRTSFTLQYFTHEPCETRVQVREGDVSMVAWHPTTQPPNHLTTLSWRVVDGSPGKRTFHTITVSGLKPGRRYFYRIYDPAAKPTAQERNWGANPPWRREFAVSTQAPKGRKTIIHLPVKVLLMPNVINVASAHDANGVIAPPPQKLTPEEIDLIKREYATASRFFWVNSGMRLWVDFQIQVDDRWQRWSAEPSNVDAFYKGWEACRSYPNADFRGPGGGEFTIVDTKNPLKVNKEPVFEERPFPGQIEQAFPRRWNNNTKKWEFYNSGGGTFGVDRFPQGIPARSQFLGGGDTAWLVGHEFHHQMESYGAFSLSHREDDRIVFNHYEARRREKQPDGSFRENTWSTSDRHGEHWDGMALWDRTLTDAQWLRMYFGYTITVEDADEDGFPDDDPRLPLDEKRFGSNPRKKSTDGNISDLQKVQLSTWVPCCLQSSWNKPPFQAFKPNPTHPDSDGDGLNDDVDPYPLYPWQPFIWAMRATVDGDDSEWTHVPPSGEIGAQTVGLRYGGGEVVAQSVRLRHGGSPVNVVFKQSHDEAGYYGCFLLRGNWKRVYAVFDGEGKGVYSGPGVQGFQVFNNEKIEVRPVFGNAPGLRWKASRKPDGTTVLEFSFPNRGEGIWFWTRGGREVGAAIDVFDESGRGYSMYEPYRLFYCRMLEPTGRPPLPAGAPTELTWEAASKVLLPGDPALKFSAGNWKWEGGALKHTGGDESAVYVEVPNVTEFDLWMRFEAKQDGILGAFCPGTERLSAGNDYIAFVGGYANTVTRLRIFGREEGDEDVRMTPGLHTMQLTRRDGNLWLLFDGKPILWAADPDPKKTVNRLAVLGGYGGEQVVHEVRVKH